MRIVSWNCNGALRRKYPALAALGADLYVLQECEDPNASRDASYRDWAAGALWVGERPQRGLALIAPEGGLVAGTRPEPGPRHFLHGVWRGFPVCAVWAHRAAVGGRHYVGQVCDYLAKAPCWLDDPGTLMAGDFNSNRMWDRPGRDWGHMAMVRALAARGLRSAWHQCNDADYGAEAEPSFFLHRNPARPYHIDYVFAGRGWQVQGARFGAPADWLTLSDHLPLVVDLARVPDAALAASG